MKSFKVTIAENKEDIFIEMMKSLNFVKKVQVISDTGIPDEHKQIVQDRIQQMEEDPENYLIWEDIEKKLKL